MSTPSTSAGTPIGPNFGGSSLPSGPARSSPTAISGFACSPADMQLIDAIITHAHGELEQQPLPKCAFCGRLSLTHSLSIAHSEESCLANAASLASKRMVPLADDSALEKEKVPELKFPQKKGPSVRRTRKKFASAGAEEDDDFANSMISSIVVSPDGHTGPAPRKKRKTPSSKKASSGRMPDISDPLTPIMTQMPNKPHIQQQHHLDYSSPSEISLWIPMLADASHLVAAMLDGKAASFSLQRPRMQMLLAGNHMLAAKRKRAPIFVDAVAQGLDHIIRTSLVGRRRLAAAASAAASALSSGSAPLSLTSKSTPPNASPPDANAGISTVKKKRSGPATRGARLHPSPPVLRPTATALSMPEI